MPALGLAQDRERARALFDEASSQFEAGNYLLALQGFEQSRALMEGDARAQTLILFNIARTQEELQRYREALATFERYLADAPPDAPYVQQTHDRVRELRLRVASMPAESASTPAHGSAPAASGSNDALVVAGIVTVVVGAALGGLSAGFLAERERHAVAWNNDAECLVNGMTREQNCRPLREAVEANQAAAIGVAIGGGVALIGGAVLLAIGASSGGASSDQASFGCTSGPGLIGIACGGSF
jgi:tetratricopeptide (TPR) repeat protein